jgi:hypothetical protein
MAQHYIPVHKARSQLRLNIFALPNQTSILVFLLVATLFGFVLAISTNAAIPLWPLALALLLLSLRRLLAWPEREIRQCNLEPAGETFQPLQGYIAYLSSADKLALRRVPQLVLSSERDSIITIGAVQRWYLVMDRQIATFMLEQLHDPEHDPEMVVYIEAVLLHELHHFKHGDNLQVGYARDLLGASLRLFGWAAAFLLGLYTLVLIAAQDFFSYSPVELVRRFDAVLPGIGVGAVLLAGLPSMAEWEEVRQQAANINLGLVAFSVFGNTYALAIIAGTLILLLWRKILRMREFYADAGVAHIQRDIVPLLQARIRLSPGVALHTTTIEESASTGVRVAQTVSRQVRSFWSDLWDWVYQWQPVAWLGQVLRENVSLRERRVCLCDPNRVYGTWKAIAVLVGFSVLVLDILLAGTSALLYIGQWPLHFPVLTTFVVVGLYMVIWLVIGRPVWRDSVKIVGLVMAFRAVMIIVSLLLLIATLVVNPAGLENFINTWAAFVAGYAGNELLEIDPTEFVIQASLFNLLQLPMAFGLMLASIWGYTWVMRRVLTWYGYLDAAQHVVTLADAALVDSERQRRRWLRVTYILVFWGALVAGLGVLPLVTDLILLRFDEVFLPWRIIGLAVALIIFSLGLVWFWRQDRRYAQRCPHCGTAVPGHYELGKRCPECEQLLHPWLFVEYNTELTS